jgi:hypothetical protein
MKINRIALRFLQSEVNISGLVGLYRHRPSAVRMVRQEVHTNVPSGSLSDET